MNFQPSSKNSALDALGILIGDWDTEISSFQADPTAQFRGQASFQWLDGGAFVQLHAQVPNSEFPTSTALIGADDSAGSFCMLYFDLRGVSRIYQMDLGKNTWNLWRDFPGFSQRFTATFSENKNVLSGSWEASTDGTNWEHDFDIKYTKIRKT